MSRAELSRLALANRYPQLEYGVRLLERVVNQPIFSDLGYTDKQQSIAERVVQGLSGGRFDTRPSPSLTATYVGRESDTVSVAMLRSGGYAVDAFYGYYDWVPKPKKDLSNAVDIIASFVTTPPDRVLLPPFPEMETMIARLRMIPAMLADMSPELVARFIYEGAEGTSQKIGLVAHDDLTEGLSPLFRSMAIYQAEYLDEDMKDLLVWTDFEDKDSGFENPRVMPEHWRRVVTVEMDKQSWVAFARTSVDFRFPE